VYFDTTFGFPSLIKHSTKSLQNPCFKPTKYFYNNYSHHSILLLSKQNLEAKHNPTQI